MKKICNVVRFLAAVVLTGFVACGGVRRGAEGALMSSQADIDLAVRYTAQFIDGGCAVTKVSFEPETNKGVRMQAGYMRVYYYESADADRLSVLLSPLMASGGDARVETACEAGCGGMTADRGVRFADIDFSALAAYVNRAGERVVAAGGERGEELYFSGFGGLTMTFDGDAKNPHIAFTIESIDKETSTATTDEYYEFGFEVLGGELTGGV